MADNKVVHAKTTEKTLRLDDKLLKKISDKAWSLRLSSDQALMRQILEEYFKKEEEVKQEKKYSPSVTLTYSSQDTFKKVMKAAAKIDKHIDLEDIEEGFKLVVEDGLKVEELEKKIKSQQQQIFNLESDLSKEKMDKEYFKKRVHELTFGDKSKAKK